MSSQLESSENTTEDYTIRPYQRTAIDATVHHTTALIRGSLDREDVPLYSTAGLLEMATGSGKTFTVGKFLEEIILLRDRFNRRYQSKRFQWLNILVLTNRIDGLDQFRDDLVHGKTGEKPKSPIIKASVRENFRIKTFHSKADNLSDIDEKYFTQSEEDEEEVLSKQNGRMKDNLFFSTFQTAIIKDLAYKLQDIDLIIIDEAHNVKPGNDYDLLLQDLLTLGRDGHVPMLLPVTATPTQLTKELFGEAISTFGLAEYIASEYSPDIDYRLVSATTATSEQIQSIKDKIETAKQCHNSTEKRSLVREIERDFDAIMASYPDISRLVHDLLHMRIGTTPDAIGQTIIFANNTREADDIARTINEQCGAEIALSYHSYNDQKQAVSWSQEKQSGLHRFAHTADPIKVIVSVGKLNESVDVPTVRNIVFWRGTDIEKIFLQQFGRWLRGDGVVNYYDYVGGLRNFAWIGEIHDQWRGIIETRDGGEWDERSASGFRLIGGSAIWEDQSIDLSELGFQIVELTDNVRMNLWTTKEGIIASLLAHGISNGMELEGKWPKWFKKTFGRSDLGVFLGRNFKFVSLKELQELASKLGWNMEIPEKIEKPLLWTTKEEIIASLLVHGISNGTELKGKWPVWFQKTFGIRGLGAFLGRNLSQVSLKDLQELASQLGWTIGTEKPPLWTTKEEIIASLLVHGISNGMELEGKWPVWFQKTFAKTSLRIFLGRSFKFVTLKELQELASKLGWNMEITEKVLLWTTKEEIIVSLLVHGISNGTELEGKWPKWFQKTFGIRGLGAFLGRNLRQVNLKELQELASQLGWSMEITEKSPLWTTKEEIIVSLLVHGISNGMELEGKWPKWFRKTFGKIDLGIFLGRSFRNPTLKELQELASKLGWGS